MNTTSHVLARYSAAAQRPEAESCGPVVCDPEPLRMSPAEVISQDDGCGDPSGHVREGDTLLALVPAAEGEVLLPGGRLVGPRGRVIGVHVNDGMPALARRYQAEMAEKFGDHRLTFGKGSIEDFPLDVAEMEEHLARSPVRGAADLVAPGPGRIGSVVSGP